MTEQNPFDLVDQQNTEKNKQVQVSKEKSGKVPYFFDGIIKFFARLSGQPDPKTGKKIENKASSKQGEKIPKGNAPKDLKIDEKFEKAMGGVSDFLGKVGDTLEDAGEKASKIAKEKLDAYKEKKSKNSEDKKEEESSEK